MSEQPVAGPSGTRGGTLDPVDSTDASRDAEHSPRSAGERAFVEDPLDEQDPAQRGWMEFRSTTPTRSSTLDTASRRSNTIELRDGSTVRRLPSPPSRPHAASDSVPPAAYSTLHDDPFRPSSDLSSLRGSLFASESGPSSTPRALPDTRSNSDPQSLASTLPAGPEESAYDLSAFGTHITGEFDDHDEEVAARSLLQPRGPAPTSNAPRDRAQRSPYARPYLAPISTSPSRLGDRKSVDVTQAGAAGWTQLTPTRSAEGGLDSTPQGLSPLAGLARRDTLSAAMDRIRRVSVRVVNLRDNDAAGEDEVDQPRTPVPRSPLSQGHRTRTPETLRRSSSIHTLDSMPSKERDDDDQSTLELDHGQRGYEFPAAARAEQSYRQLRGKTLGVFGPEHRLRRACAAVLTAKWTEPVILLLIILQIVVQTIRSSYNVYTHPRPAKGFFHSWEDVVLFVVFCAFTIEIFARVVVTGLVINPPRPVAPLDSKANPYGTPSRTPSIVTRIQSHLSPLRSHSSAAAAQSLRSASPTPSRSTAGESQITLAVPDSLSAPEQPSAALAFRPSATTYPPSAAEPSPGVVAVDYGDAKTPSGRSRDPFADDVPSAGRLTPIEPSPAFSVRTGLASSLSVATAPAEGNYAASSLHGGSTGTGPGPFAYTYAPYALSIKRQRQTYQQAFLRHSFNRIDLVAVVSFWISFVLSMTGAEAAHNLWFFRALSVLRATRLLAVTAGTQTILQSLKKASPLLVNVGFFTIFAMLLFAIVGVQAFSESYKRYCVWIDPEGLLPNVTSSQNCGGYFVSGSDDPRPYLIRTGLPSPESPKGYLCGAPSICIETENPTGGTWSFDNVLAALFQVVVIASANTWTGTMYQMMDADYFVSCLYFIAGIIVLNYWMLNLVVAVITSTFADIREQTKHSAFAATSVRRASQRYDDNRKPQRGWSRTSSIVRLGYRKTRLVWVALILVSICFQANRSFNMSERADRLADWMEFSITLALDAEILIRLFTYLPDWRQFFSSNSNRVDLLLAVVTTILILPGIFETAAYAWLTIFQIARFYRVILAIPRTRRLLLRVLGTITGLANMVLFLLLMTFIAALIAVEFFRGIPDPNGDDTGFLTFYQIFDSFLAMYQILSSENWTDVTNTVLGNQTGTLQIVLSGFFLAVWMLFSYFILCNMFIAVINENFAIADEEKRARQIAAFVGRTQTSTDASTASWFRRFDPYTYATTRSRKRAEAQTASSEGMIDRKLTASPDAMGGSDSEAPAPAPPSSGARLRQRIRRLLRPSGIYRVVEYFAAPLPREEPITTRVHDRDVTYEAEAEALVLSSQQQRQQTVADFIAEHPSYDKSLYIFKQSSRLRQICQRLVDPCSGGVRLHGRSANKYAKWAFQGLIFAAIIASIGVAAAATPAYRRQYYLKHGHVLVAWYNLTEVLLAIIFIVEFVVKVVADGFLFTPNAYLLSIANDIDFFVLLTIIVNISTLLVTKTGDDRFTRSLKAFRALRLINIWPSVRETFYSVLILGASRILDASILAVLYIIPYAVWAANVFRGLLYSCNDTSVSRKAECVGEYLASPVADWTFLAPRVWSNPSVWSFDTFRSSLLILFEIVSLEGWIDVMESVMNIKGRDLQPEEKAAQFNALLIVVYNLIGALFILTIFVSVIIESFVRRSGNSLLTTEQRQWQDLRRLIGRQRPARQPAHRPANAVRAWCYERAVHKHGWWTRGVTALYVANVAVLLTQATTTSKAHDVYNWLFLGFVAAYTVDVAVRLVGLGFKYFFTNPWNAYDLAVIIGVNISTFPILAGVDNSAFIQLQKVFLVGLVFKLVQRNDSLNQLFKTATAALPTILNIFALWLILFLTFALFYMEVFGLTRWGPHGTSLANYYSFASTLVLLALQSTGEGWNEFMHDYTMEWPACTYSPFYLLSDCGSSPWAYTLFIVWNILSMYLFVNLVLGAVVESFSFAFQDYGKVTRIKRSDMRTFKQVWASFDPGRTGYIQPRDVGRFLGRLHGVFELKIYRDEWSLQRLLGASYRSERDQHNAPAFVHYLDDRDALSLRRIDLVTLGSLIDAIDVREVAVRRRNFTLAYHEAMHDAEESHKGLSFSKLLLLIAHYRLINDESALQMDELAKRRRKRQLIQRRVDNDRVSSFLRMVVLRRRFLAHLEEKRRREYGHVPDINVVDATPSLGASADSEVSLGPATRRRHGERAVVSTVGHTVQPGLVRDQTPLESIASTLQTWSPFGGLEPRRAGSDRAPATSPAPAPFAGAVGYASDVSSDEEDSDSESPRRRGTEDDPAEAARRALGSAEAIAWAKWDDLVLQGSIRRALLIGYRSGGIALWDCTDLDNFVELLNLSSLALASEGGPSQSEKKRTRCFVDGALLPATPQAATEPAVLVLLGRPQHSSSSTARSHLIFYSLRAHKVLGRVAVPGTAHQVRVNRRFLVVSTSAPLALHTFDAPRFDAGEFSLVPTPFSPIRDVAASSYDGAPVFSLGTGGRLLAYATSNPIRSSRLGGLPAKFGHGILARAGTFDSKSSPSHGTPRGSLGLSDAPDVARRVSEGVLGGVSALKDAGMSYWAQSQSRGPHDVSPQTYSRSHGSQGSPIAHGRSAPTGKTLAITPRAEARTVIVLDLLGTSRADVTRSRNLHGEREGVAATRPKIVASFVPSDETISQLSFSPTSTHLLVAADGAHFFDVFELKPPTAIGSSATSTGPAAESGANVWHRYRLERGITSAHARDVSWSADGRFVAISTAKGTTHIYAVHPAGGNPLLETHFGPHVVNSFVLPPLSLSLQASARVRPAASQADEVGSSAWMAANASAARSARVAFVARSATAASSFAKDDGCTEPPVRPGRSGHPPLNAQDFLVFQPDSGGAILHRLRPQEVVVSPSLSATTTSAVAAASRGEIGKLATTAVSGLTQLMRSRGAHLIGGQTPIPRSEQREVGHSSQGAEKTWKVRCRTLAGWDLRKGQDWPEVREVVTSRTSTSAVHTSVASSLHSAFAEIETSSRAPRVMPTSIYASRQFNFFALPPDHKELTAKGVVAASEHEIHFRPEVRVRQGTSTPAGTSTTSKSSSKGTTRKPSEFAPASFDQPIKSAMHTFLDPETVLAPGSPQLRPPTFPNGVPGKHGSWRDSIQIPRGVAPAAMEGIERVRQSLGQIRVPKGMIPVTRRRGSGAGALSADGIMAYSTSISFEDEDAVFADRELGPSQSVSTACTTDVDDDRGAVKSLPCATSRHDAAGFGDTLAEDWDDRFAEEDQLGGNPTVGDSPESAMEATIGDFEHFELELPLPPSGIPAMPTLAVPSPFALDPVDDGDSSPSVRKQSGTTSFANTPKDGLPPSRPSGPEVGPPDLLTESAAPLAAAAIPILAVPVNVAHGPSPSSSVSSTPSSRSSGKRKKRR